MGIADLKPNSVNAEQNYFISFFNKRTFKCKCSNLDMKDILFWTNVLQNNIDVQFTCIFIFIGNSEKKKGILCYIAVHTLGLSR